jgi:phosphomannomutase
MAGIFKAYDIRGIYGDTLTDEIMERIGRAFVTFTKCRNVVVGRDMRPHSEPLFAALARGLTTQGADVIDLGLCSTPMSYYANGLLGAEAGIMITASHNTGEWNGVKLSRAQAVPIGGDTGIADIERMVQTQTYGAPARKSGRVRAYDIGPAYREHVQKMAGVKRPLCVAADLANAMGVCEVEALRATKNLTLETMFETMDGTFPNHEANPLHHETLAALQARLRAGGYDFGVAFDGDADRAGFLDERGGIIPMDNITALIAQDLLAREKGPILYDLRSSWATREVVQEAGGTPIMSRVGHAFIKKQMREANALFAGELSGHYYFRANYYTESTSMAVLCVANVVSRASRPLSELVRPLRRYHASGEINSTVKDAPAVLARLERDYADGKVFHLDGVSVEYPDWWFNVRASNTEPLVRLNLEAKSPETMARKRDELLAKIRG